MLDPVLSVLQISSHFDPVTTLRGRYYCYYHFTDEKLRHQMLSPVISPVSDSQKVGQPRLSQKAQFQGPHSSPLCYPPSPWGKNNDYPHFTERETEV